MPVPVLFNQPISGKERDSCGKVLVGLQLSSVSKGDYSWTFGFADGSQVITESRWRLLRIVGDEPIIITSEDDGHQFGLPEPVDAAKWVSSRIVGHQVVAAEVFPESGDLMIEFTGGIWLELLQMSAGYEAWEFHVRDVWYVCQGGGKVCRVVPWLGR